MVTRASVSMKAKDKYRVAIGNEERKISDLLSLFFTFYLPLVALSRGEAVKGMIDEGVECNR